jgi:hypothetical protein
MSGEMNSCLGRLVRLSDLFRVHHQRFHSSEGRLSLSSLRRSTTDSACIRRWATSVPCSLRRGVYLNSVSMESWAAHPGCPLIMCKVVNHHSLCYGWLVVVRASRRSWLNEEARNIDVALSENLVGSQT